MIGRASSLTHSQDFSPYAFFWSVAYSYLTYLSTTFDLLRQTIVARDPVRARVAKLPESLALRVPRKAGVRVLLHGWRKVRGRCRRGVASGGF